MICFKKESVREILVYMAHFMRARRLEKVRETFLPL
jgi:hypothetical protein